MININKVQQVVNEDWQARSNILEVVRNDIEGGIDQIKQIFTNVHSNVIVWMRTKGNKNRSYAYKLREIEPRDLATEIVIAVTRSNKPVSIQAVMSNLVSQLDLHNDNNNVKIVGALFSQGIDTGLFDLRHSQMSDSLMVIPNIHLDPETQAFIDKTRYLDPMVCIPQKWKHNYGGGYLTITQHAVLGSHNHHNEEQALDALNIAQEVEWELDEFILEFEEEPNKKLETREQKDAHSLMAQTSELVYENMLNQGNSFYFPWRFDFRGRMYSQGYYINLQSTSYKKAILNFAKRQLIQ